MNYEPIEVTIKMRLKFEGRKAPGFQTVQRAVAEQLKGLAITAKSYDVRPDQISVGVTIPDSLPGSPGKKWAKAAMRRTA